MSAIAVPFRQLVERRLWPLAVLLIAALAAVPVLLAKGEDAPLPSPVASAADVADAAASSLATQPIVSVGEPSLREARRSVLGKRKNPFKPEVAAKKAKTAEAVGTTTVTNGPTPGGSTIRPGLLGGGTTVMTPGNLPKKTYELHSLTVRFGASTAEKLGVRNLKRLTSLPSVAQPVIIYLGMLGDSKTAVFLVDAAASVQGDGKCQPDPANCQTLHLKAGETAFFDMTVGNLVQQYQLDFVRVKVKRTTDPKAAARSRAAVAAGGRDALRARSSRVNGYRYDPSTGTVQRVKSKRSRRAGVSVVQDRFDG